MKIQSTPHHQTPTIVRSSPQDDLLAGPHRDDDLEDTQGLTRLIERIMRDLFSASDGCTIARVGLFGNGRTTRSEDYATIGILLKALVHDMPVIRQTGTLYWQEILDKLATEEGRERLLPLICKWTTDHVHAILAHGLDGSTPLMRENGVEPGDKEEMDESLARICTGRAFECLSPLELWFAYFHSQGSIWFTDRRQLHEISAILARNGLLMPRQTEPDPSQLRMHLRHEYVCAGFEQQRRNLGVDTPIALRLTENGKHQFYAHPSILELVAPHQLVPDTLQVEMTREQGSGENSRIDGVSGERALRKRPLGELAEVEQPPTRRTRPNSPRPLLQDETTPESVFPVEHTSLREQADLLLDLNNIFQTTSDTESVRPGFAGGQVTTVGLESLDRPVPQDDLLDDATRTVSRTDECSRPLQDTRGKLEMEGRLRSRTQSPSPPTDPAPLVAPLSEEDSGDINRTGASVDTGVEATQGKETAKDSGTSHQPSWIDRFDPLDFEWDDL